MTLHLMDRARFDEMYAIMEDSFPSDEHRPRAAQLNIFDDARYSVYTYEENGSIRAFLATWTLGEWCFIEHFAVIAEARNGGLGGNMLKAFLEMSDRRVCLEVEPPLCELAKRRIGFYRRQGLTLNEYPYVQPAMGEGQNAIPLLIMTSDGEINKAEFESLRALLYRHVYHIDP